MDSNIIILAYVIQIPLAIYAAFFIPMRGELSEFFDRVRKAIIFVGVLPCGVISVVAQLTYLAAYMFKVKSVKSKVSSAQRRLSTSSGGVPASGGNPFVGGSEVPRAPAGENPFGGERAPSKHFGDNSFDDVAGPPTPPRDNPFA